MLITVVLLLLFSGVTSGEGQSRSETLQSLVEAERAFARTCLEKGIRASFLEFFAEDGIAFRPGPVKYREAVGDAPPEDNPLAVVLEWEPQTGNIAASCDLGFTTGPYILSDRTGTDNSRRYGQFFSVWQKQSDGRWKVAADIGISTPVSPLGTPFKESGEITAVSCEGDTPITDQRDAIMNLERQFSESCSSEGVLSAYLSRADETTRLHRQNTFPLVGTDSIRSYLDKELHIPVWSPTGGGISIAGDLGYAYGSYEYLRGAQVEEKGYYLRVWRRDENGEWKLVADITNPAPLDKEE